MMQNKGKLYMKIFAISDIHGCIHSFLDALQLVDLSGDYQFVL